jgi:hypothetical protein
MRYLLPLLLFAVAARAELKTDIEFAKAGGTNLTLDAFVPEGGREVVAGWQIIDAGCVSR